ARKPTSMRIVVDARHDQSEHEQRHGISDRFAANRAAAAASAVVDQCTEQSKDGGRRANREVRATQKKRKRYSSQIKSSERTQREAADPCDRVDDHHAGSAIDFCGCRAKLSYPQHVEQDMERAAVQPARTGDRPPAVGAKDGGGAARAEQEQALKAWGE